MYIAYVKPELVGEKNGVAITNSKKDYCGGIAFLKETKRKNVYLMNGTKFLFSTEWLDGLTDMDTTPCGVITSHHSCVIAIIHGDKYRDPVSNIVFSSNDNYHPAESLNQTYIGSSFYSYQEKCRECDKEIFIDFMHNGYCHECMEIKYDTCSCGSIQLKEEISTLKTDRGDKKVCDNCIGTYHQCVDCGIYITKNKKIFDEETYCVDCFTKTKNNLITCEKCGTHFEKDSKYLQNVRGKIVCSSCSWEVKTRGGGARIEDYNYKPQPIFYGAGSLFYGIELEVVTPYQRSDKYYDRIASYIQSTINDFDPLCYCKYDRSVGNDGMNGFEIVTHPLSYNWIIGEGKEKIHDMLDVKKFECTSFNSNTCGMHIHMSKEAFTKRTLRNFLYFMNTNEKFIYRISERNDRNKFNEYSMFISDTDILNYMAENAVNHRGGRHGRHIAINLSSRYTVETRIFRGTLNYERFMKNIEFCKAVYDFSKDRSFVNDPTNFKEFITKKEEYTNLKNFIEKKGL